MQQGQQSNAYEVDSESGGPHSWYNKLSDWERYLCFGSPLKIFFGRCHKSDILCSCISATCASSTAAERRSDTQETTCPLSSQRIKWEDFNSSLLADVLVEPLEQVNPDPSRSAPGSSITRLSYPSAIQTLLASPNTDQGSGDHRGPHTTYTINASQRVTHVVDAAGRTQEQQLRRELQHHQ